MARRRHCGRTGLSGQRLWLEHQLDQRLNRHIVGRISSVTATLNGAGSTFAAPIYQQWGARSRARASRSTTRASAPAAGIAEFTDGTVLRGQRPGDEGRGGHGRPEEGRAGPLPDRVRRDHGLLQPRRRKKGLKLDGKTIADIYLGKIKKWNDPAIAKQNPGMSLPSPSITVVHRSDGSGTTKGFTDFLPRYSPEWKSKVGVDKTVKWPTGTGAKGNEGVAAAVKQTAGVDRLRRAGVRAPEQLHVR